MKKKKKFTSSKEITMKKFKADRKQTISAIALISLLAISTVMAIVPAANAHTPPWTVPTWCYISITSPNPTAVNNDALLVFWLNAVPPTAQGAYGDRWTFYVDVTKPDGTKQTLGPFKSDPVGSCYTIYTLEQTGNYIFQARFDGQKITGQPLNPNLPAERNTGYAYWNDTYAASKSDPITITVLPTMEQVQGWQEPPVTTDYWTLPLNSMNRGWYVLASNWLGGAAQTNGPTERFGYGTAPESPHVLWAKPMWAGGIMDARFGPTGYQTAHYEGLSFTPPIILNGKIYYNVQSLPRIGWYCIDLYTGEIDYFHNTTGPVINVGGGFDYSGQIAGESLAFGQILNYNSPNQHGGFPYLWSTTALADDGPIAPNTWMMFDAYSGNYICSIANVSASGTAVYGKDGSILRYNIVNLGNASVPNYYLQVWNTTQAIWYEKTWRSNEYWMWRPVLNMTYDGNNGFSLNASIPDLGTTTIRAVREDQFIIGGYQGVNNEDGVRKGYLWALNLKPDSNGVINPTLLWNITFTPPSSAGNKTITMGAVDPEDGVFLFHCTQTRERWGYSLATGEKLWGPTAPEAAFNYYGMGTNIYQGKLLSYGYGGVLTAYNITTGEILWVYNATNVGWESPYGNYPIGVAVAADGKLYLVSSEHSPTQPLWRGSYLRCVDANTGEELWKMSLWGGRMSPTESNVFLSQGYLVGLNFYDNRIYCIGKGPSATTVSAPQTAIAKGKSLMLTGTVTDQSPGAKGTPAISDADQQAWMEYLYQQQAMPTSATGVPVQITAIGPNNETINIGTAITDIGGSFGIMWTPPEEGTYQITATFAGSKSYGSSYATTYIGVGPEETPSSPKPTAPQITQTLAPTQTPTFTPTQTTTTSPTVAPNPTS